MRTRTNVFSPDLRVLILIEDIEYLFKLWPLMPSIELASLALDRRHCLRLIAGLSAFLLAPSLWAKKMANPLGLEPQPSPDFNALLNDLMGVSPQTEDHGLTMEVPPVAENGALVPVVLSASGSADALYLLAKGNPGPLLAEFHFRGPALTKVSLRVKLNQTGPVTALSRSPEGWMRLDQPVKVAKGGCG